MAETKNGYHATPTTVGRLDMHTTAISPNTPMGWVIRELEHHHSLPGVLVFENNQYQGMLSRRKIYERLGRPYAFELFMKHPASRFYSDFEIYETPIASRMRVEDAVRLALGRQGEQIYEPLVVIHDDGKLSLLDMQILLLAQSQLLVNANRVVEQLYNVSSVISSSLDVNTVLDVILDYMAGTIPYDRCVVLFFKGDQVDFAALRGFPKNVDMRQMRQVVIENSVYEAVRHSKQAMCIDDVLGHKEWPHLPHVAPARTWLGIPLAHAGQVSGMLVAISLEPGAYNEEQVQLAQKIAEQAALALRNAMLYKEVKLLNQQLESAIQERTRDLGETLKKLEVADTSKTEFLKSVARQLTNPIKKITAYKQFIQNNNYPDSNTNWEQILNNITEEIDNLHAVADKIHDVAAIESNEFQLKREAIKVNKLLQNLRETYTPILQERRLNLHLLNLDKLPDLDGDPHMLRKAFGNLLENAIQHTPIGGKITISGAHRVEIVDQKARSEIQITVSDTGIGIDRTIQDKIFEKTFRYKKPNVNILAEDAYAGLGLAIADGIIRAHNGRIWVESRGRDVILNPGSHFHVVLPAIQGTGKSATTMPVGAIL